jgi:hypothetical protein
VIVRTAFAVAVAFFVYRRVEAQTICTITELGDVVGIAAVAFVPRAFDVVVRIVTESVAQVFCDTSTALVFGIKAQTFRAVLRIYVRAAAVSTVPVTGAVVVIVIAELVTLVIVRTAFAVAVAFFVYRRVEAQTICTITELADVVGIAAVAFVPRAFDVVVRIVTESVAHVFCDTSTALVFGIKAQTVRAVLCIYVRAAAVSTVPVARCLVVAVIAMIVALVLWQTTFTRACFAIGVSTLACIAVNKLLQVLLSRGVATIAAIIFATFDVVFVVTISVALELRIAAFLLAILFFGTFAAFARAFEHVLEDAT